MSRIEPPVTDLSAPFWEATRRQQLLAQRCDRCERFVWYPRSHCPTCLRDDGMRWVEASGCGVIYTFNVMRKPGNPMMVEEVPYVVALVDLDEGYRMTTNLIGVDPSSLECGQHVAVDWSVELSDGRRLPTFTTTTS